VERERERERERGESIDKNKGIKKGLGNVHSPVFSKRAEEGF
jgi:hypothetical protein